MRKYSCGFGNLPPFSQWVFDKSRVRLIRHECQEIGRFAQNLEKSYSKSHKAYASSFLDATFSHNIIDKKPLTLLKKEHETLTLRKRPQGPGKKEEKIDLKDFPKDFVRF